MLHRGRYWHGYVADRLEADQSSMKGSSGPLIAENKYLKGLNLTLIYLQIIQSGPKVIP